MKHCYHFLLAMLVALANSLMANALSFSAQNEDGKVIYYRVISSTDMTCAVTSGLYSYTGDISIPSSVSYEGKDYRVTVIDNMAFSSNSDLKSVVIPGSVETIANYAFSDCDALASVVILGGGATTIGERAFSNCRNLTSIDMRDGVTSIGFQAFYRCDALAEVVIPGSVTTIGVSAFSDCSGLKSVRISYGVTSIGGTAFYGCSGLTEVVFPSSVTTIGKSAFYSCSDLTSVFFPESITTIENWAFAECGSLARVYSASTTPPTCGGAAFSKVGKTCTLYVRAEAVDAYKAVSPWNNMNVEAYEFTTVAAPSASHRHNGKMYDLRGMEVNGTRKGIIIKDGKKIVVK